MTTPHYLTTDTGHKLAYVQHDGSGPVGVVFVHGFLSNMEGSKALALEAHCRARGLGFLRLDCSGHGASDGRVEDGCIGVWAADVVRLLDAVTTGPQVLIGSSMGGWLMLLAALQRPERIAGLIGIAAAPDFTEELMWQQLPPEARDEIEHKGVYYMPCDDPEGDPYPVTRQLIDDGRENLLLTKPIPLTCPVHLLHGQQDGAVPWKTSLRLAEALTSAAVQVTLVKDGNHSLSRPQDLRLLTTTLDNMVDACGHDD